MPKKIAGLLTVDFIVVADDGSSEGGTVRAEASRVHFKVMQRVAKAVRKVQGEVDTSEPAAPVANAGA